MKISAVVAMSKNWVIGKNNSLPWKLKEDLVRFRKLTTHHPIIMGRKTFESIGRLLPEREHFIVSRNPDYQVSGTTVIQSIEEAIRLAEGKSDEVFIIGGAEIYLHSLPNLDRIYLTVIHKEIEGDAYFPLIQLDQEYAEKTGNLFSLPKPVCKQGSQAVSRITFIPISVENHLNAPLPYSFIVLEKPSGSTPL
jgi:dihydrofolate reductase